MGLRFFTIPVRDSEKPERELNGFLASHKVLSIDRQLVDVGMNSFWAICVDYLMTSAGESTLASNLSRSRVDYKTILPPDEFDVFSKLRQLRKELAQHEAVPVYALFTNEQLAQMVQRRCRSRSDVAQIEGIGEGKIEKYVDRCNSADRWRSSVRLTDEWPFGQMQNRSGGSGRPQGSNAPPGPFLSHSASAVTTMCV